MDEKTILERLRDTIAQPEYDDDIRKSRQLMSEAVDLLEAFFNQMQSHTLYMDGNHQWRLRGSGWPMSHCKGLTPEEAMKNVVAEIKRARKAQEAT